MTRNHKPDNKTIEPFEPKAIRHFKQAIVGGKHWYIALLESIGLWETAEETIDERTYQYIIASEAFDWLLLAERLCVTLKGLIPEAEMIALLFYGKPPLDLPAGEFKKLIGNAKYHQQLNYFYGITAEEALILAVEDEVRKEKRVSGYLSEMDTTIEAFRRVYSTPRDTLLRQFRKEKKYSQLKSTSLTEIKEFTYWLFQRRLTQNDKAKVASDTKKALDWLENKGYFRQSGKRNYEEKIIDITPS